MTDTIIEDFFVTFILSFLLFLIYAAVSYLYAKARKFPREVSGTVEISMSMPNDGFMGFPVALIFFDDTGMLLMLAHNAAMSLYTFSYCMRALRRNKNRGQKPTMLGAFKALMKLLVNPNILAIIIGFAISIPGFDIPSPVDEYLLYIGGISTPMAMIYIGSSLQKYRFIDIIRDKLVIEASVMKLIWLPLLTIGVVCFLPISTLIKNIVVLGIAFPTAATASMLSEQEDQAPGVASQILFMSTVASLLTVPLTVQFITFLF